MGTYKDVRREIDERAVHVVEGILLGPDWNVAKPDKDKVGLDMSVDLLERHPQSRSYFQIKGKGPRTRTGKHQALIGQNGTLSQTIETGAPGFLVEAARVGLPGCGRYRGRHGLLRPHATLRS